MSNYSFKNINENFTLPCDDTYLVNFPENEYFFVGSPINNMYSYFGLEINLIIDKILLEKDRQYLIDLLITMKLKIFYSDIFLNVDNNDFVPKYFISFFETNIGLNKQLKANLDFINNEFVIDKNLLMENTQSGEKKSHLLHFNTEQIMYYDETFLKNIKNDTYLNNCPFNYPIAQITIDKKKFIYKYNIVHKKFPNVLAQAGGVLNALVTAIKFIGFIFVDFEFYSSILKQTLDIDFNSAKENKDIDDENTKKIENSSQRLKKLFSEINFIKSKNLSRESRDLDLEISNEVGYKDNTNMNLNQKQLNKNSSSIEIEKNKNYLANLKAVDVNVENSSQRSVEMSEDVRNKMNSYMIASDKAKKINDSKKNKFKFQDEVFFKDDIFNYIDFGYGFYRKCFNLKSFGQLDNRYDLFLKSKKNFDKNFEVNYIIKKNIEIDLIKYLLLSTDQLNLYKLVKKPLISLLENNMTPFDKAYDEFNEDKLFSKAELKSLPNQKKENFKKSFTYIYDKKQSNVINRKLLSMIEERLTIMLENKLD